MLEAKDLPRCDLSDFIEQRLALAIGRDRHERARQARVQVEQARPACPNLALPLPYLQHSSCGVCVCLGSVVGLSGLCCGLTVPVIATCSAPTLPYPCSTLALPTARSLQGVCLGCVVGRQSP